MQVPQKIAEQSGKLSPNAVLSSLAVAEFGQRASAHPNHAASFAAVLTYTRRVYCKYRREERGRGYKHIARSPRSKSFVYTCTQSSCLCASVDFIKL